MARHILSLIYTQTSLVAIRECASSTGVVCINVDIHLLFGRHIADRAYAANGILVEIAAVITFFRLVSEFVVTIKIQKKGRNQFVPINKSDSELNLKLGFHRVLH